MKKSAMLGFTLFLICLTTEVSANSTTLSSEDITMDIYRRLDKIERQGQERLDEIERQGQEQHAELAALREENAQLRDENAKLAQRVKILEDFQRMAIDDVFKEQQTKSKIKDMDEKVKISKVIKNGQLDESNVSDGNASTTKEEQELVPTHGHNRIRQSDQGSTVAFFATRGDSNAEHLGIHQALLFDRIITNIGQGYHNTTGIFIAPVSGVYVFSTTILAYSNAAHFDFVVNGQPKSKLYADISDTSETTSQTAIVRLSKGDDVSIQSNDLNVFVYGYGYTTFSGFLLAPADGVFIVG